MDAEKKKRQRDDTIESLLRHAGIRARHHGAVKSRSEVWNKCLQKLIARIGSGAIIALVGERGTGKTQLAVSCIRAACRSELQAVYTTAMDIFIDLRDAYKLQESERAVLLRFQRPALLVIDEAQERGESAWEDRMLTALIDYRYSQMRDTIIISNLKRTDFEASMGSSIVSRMVETGGIVECNWPSFRYHKNAKEA